MFLKVEYNISNQRRRKISWNIITVIAALICMAAVVSFLCRMIARCVGSLGAAYDDAMGALPRPAKGPKGLFSGIRSLSRNMLDKAMGRAIQTYLIIPTNEGEHDYSIDCAIRIHCVPDLEMGFQLGSRKCIYGFIYAPISEKMRCRRA